jgi:N-acetylglucosamine-6-phosphate deacetylase
VWVDTGIPLEPEAVAERRATIIDPKPRFWEAAKLKDYASHLVFDVSDYYIVPGFIDIQINGAFGVDFSTIPTNADTSSPTAPPAPQPPTVPLPAFNTLDAREMARRAALERGDSASTADADAAAAATDSASARTDRPLTLRGRDTPPLERPSLIPVVSYQPDVADSAPGAHVPLPDFTRPLAAVAAQGPSEGGYPTRFALRPSFKDEDYACSRPGPASFPWHLRGALRRELLGTASDADAALIAGAGAGPDGVSDGDDDAGSDSDFAGRSVSACAGVRHLLGSDPDLTTVSRKLPRFGVTSYLPTIISSFPRVYGAVARRFRSYLASIAALERDDAGGRGACRHGLAQVLGLHLEGPFISVKGAHDPATLCAPGPFPASALLSTYGQSVLPLARLVTLAPELEGALTVVPALRAAGMTVSLGHSRTDLRTASAAVDAGAGLVTHMFNAMASFHHRDPGLVGLLGEARGVPYSIIADGIHAHPASVKIAHQCNSAGTVLVSDAMCAMGLGPGTYKLGEMTVNTDAQHRAVIAGTDTLAGAILTLDRCVYNLRQFTGCSTEEAIAAATETPARVVGVYPQKGSLCVGADADIVILDKNDLSVVATIVNGQVVYSREADFPPVRVKKP